MRTLRGRGCDITEISGRRKKHFRQLTRKRKGCTAQPMHRNGMTGASGKAMQAPTRARRSVVVTVKAQDMVRGIKVQHEIVVGL